MSATKHSVKVSILGEEYTIRSDVPPEQTKAIAKYLDDAVREVMHGGKVLDSQRAAILAALQITNDLFEARAGAEEIASSMEALSADVRRWLPPAKRGN
ncbi:MAG: cell division protein ZapA [Gemmatimonadota bacterium]|nr:cell division protein ZapA [Gemmatimonadota bacterium]MDE3171658.1 cell division protein ZapA [Gemmatimonadota bacterium]MDE3217377.1 cell division protein ZapA [Gemmatimonadota bacterium]